MGQLSPLPTINIHAHAIKLDRACVRAPRVNFVIAMVFYRDLKSPADFEVQRGGWDFRIFAEMKYISVEDAKRCLCESAPEASVKVSI